MLLPLIQAGKLRALAVTTPKRIPQLPDVPTMIESGFPDFVIDELDRAPGARAHAASRSSTSSTPRSTPA